MVWSQNLHSMVFQGFNSLSGKVASIDDNLDLHFPKEVIDKCIMKDLAFIYLPPDATHLCQPLDIAVFHPAMSEWHAILDISHRVLCWIENLPETFLLNMSVS